MRVNYEIDRDGSMVRVELTGTPLSGEIRAFAAAIGSQGGFERGMSVLIDARRLRVLPRSDEIIPLACLYRTLRTNGDIGCTAIIMDTDAGFGAARLFQIQAGDGEPQVAIFRDPDVALEWIDQMHASGMDRAGRIA